MNFVLPEMLHVFCSHHSLVYNSIFFLSFKTFMLNLKLTVLRLQTVCLFLCIHIYHIVTIHTKMNNIHTASMQQIFQIYSQWKSSNSVE